MMSPKLRFIDIFAGCGGLSLGLLEAGLEGVFAIEKSPLAFETLRFNLAEGIKHRFSWPEWLPVEAMTCEELLAGHSENLAILRGQIDLIVGGPPCQGFSTAGRRNPADPRNKLTEQYLALVGIVQPHFLVIENVAGFNMRFENEEGLADLIAGSEKSSYAKYIENKLEEIGYDVHSGLVNCADFGVPQSRHRYLMLCERKNAHRNRFDLFAALTELKAAFLMTKGLPVGRHVTTREAISDLEVKERELVPNQDSGMPRFLEAVYRQPAELNPYLTLMRAGCDEKAPNSRRLAKHKSITIDYFRSVQQVCRPGHCLSKAERKELGTKKHTTTVLASDKASPTITTLPDDILHYDEPRILTARENARLQSFPDWFAFQGKYTTGGKQRKLECPRYTQIGNAVPPLLAEAIGKVIQNRKMALAAEATEILMDRRACQHNVETQ
jgi:DNA (cytosine-5)-methyltransferase 1